MIARKLTRYMLLKLKNIDILRLLACLLQDISDRVVRRRRLAQLSSSLAEPSPVPSLDVASIGITAIPAVAGV